MERPFASIAERHEAPAKTKQQILLEKALAEKRHGADKGGRRIAEIDQKGPPTVFRGRRRAEHGSLVGGYRKFIIAQKTKRQYSLGTGRQSLLRLSPPCVYRKKILGSAHILRTPPSNRIDADIITLARERMPLRYGTGYGNQHTLRMTWVMSGKTYVVNRAWGLQWASSETSGTHPCGQRPRILSSHLSEREPVAAQVTQW